MRRAFTLIELLVVIAVIAILAAMLMPAIGMVRDGALQARCTNQARQIGLALMGYANDHEGWIPGDRWDGGGTPSDMWVQQTKSYIEDLKDPDQPAAFFADPGMGRRSPLTDFWHSNYAMSIALAWHWDATANVAVFSGTFLDAIKGRSGVAMLLGGMRVDGRVIGPYHARSPGIDGQDRFIWPHRGRRDSILYADGHAGTLLFSELPKPAPADEGADPFWSPFR